MRGSDNIASGRDGREGDMGERERERERWERGTYGRERETVWERETYGRKRVYGKYERERQMREREYMGEREIWDI